MPTFESFDGAVLWYDDQTGVDVEPREVPVVLVHGFGADAQINFVRPGISDVLVDHGYRVVMLDFRGHGRSAKPHQREAYADDAIRRDVQALLDHLRLHRVSVIGYSMGSSVATQLGATDPRVERVVLLGAGHRWLERNALDGLDTIEALLADDPDSVDDDHTRRVRGMVDSVGADRRALAALVSHRVRVADHLGSLTIPVLVITGIDDDVAGDPRAVVERITGARAVPVPGHHFSANAQPETHHAITEFLDET